MTRMPMLLALALLLPGSPATAQDAPMRIIQIFRAAPGQQVNFLKWLARQEEVSRQAGVAPVQLYVHQNGASWDFLVIAPVTTPEQDRAVDAAAAKLGAPTGPRTGIELRRYIAEHSDTFAAGPTTPAEWLKRLGE